MKEIEKHKGFIKEDQIIDIPGSKSLTKHTGNVKGKIKYWDKDYINQKIDLISNTAHKTLFFFLWRTGVRISEALAVRKRDLDFEKYTIEIQWLKNRKRETRIFPMQPELRTILMYYTSNMNLDDKLFDFSRQRADQLSRKYFNGSCHRFRHSFAINWLRNNGDLYLLSKMLGHSSVTVTEEYLQVIPVDIGRELLKINFN